MRIGLIDFFSLLFCHNSRVWQTDGQTDISLMAKTALHYNMQRGKIVIFCTKNISSGSSWRIFHISKLSLKQSVHSSLLICDFAMCVWCHCQWRKISTLGGKLICIFWSIRCTAYAVDFCAVYEAKAARVWSDWTRSVYYTNTRRCGLESGLECSGVT